MRSCSSPARAPARACPTPSSRRPAPPPATPGRPTRSSRSRRRRRRRRRSSAARVLIGFLAPLTNQEGVERIAASGATAFAMEKIPRISRAQSMDALSSQATVSGYLAVHQRRRGAPALLPDADDRRGHDQARAGARPRRRRGRPAGDRHRPPPRRRRDRLRRPRRRQGAGPVAGREVLRGRGHRPTRRRRPATPASSPRRSSSSSARRSRSRSPAPTSSSPPRSSPAAPRRS